MQQAAKLPGIIRKPVQLMCKSRRHNKSIQTETVKMKRQTVTKIAKPKVSIDMTVIQRLDESLPLQTEEWNRAEQLLMQLTEFAPNSLITEVVNAIAVYADDQARRGYILGQEDLAKEMKQRVA
jgi:hypothetical protein